MGNKGKKPSQELGQDHIRSILSRGHSPGNRSGAVRVDKRDFDANRPLLDNGEGPSGRSTRPGSFSDEDEDDEGEGTGRGGLLSEVVNEIRERDRRKVRMNVVRTYSFIWGVLSWFVFPPFPSLLFSR